MDGTTYHTPQGGDAGRLRCGALPAVCLLLEDDRDICCGNIRMEIRYVPTASKRARDLYPLAASLRLRCRGPFRAGRFPPRADPDVAFFASRRRLQLLTLGNAESPLAFEPATGRSRHSKWNWRASRLRANTLDADELYWGVCRMHVDGSRQQTFTTSEQYPLPPACQGHVAQYAGRCRSVPYGNRAGSRGLFALPRPLSYGGRQTHSRRQRKVGDPCGAHAPQGAGVARGVRHDALYRGAYSCLPALVPATRPLQSLSTCDGLSGRGAGIPTLRPYRNTASSSRFLPTAAWRCARGSTPMSKTGRTEEHSTLTGADEYDND